MVTRRRSTRRTTRWTYHTRLSWSKVLVLASLGAGLVYAGLRQLLLLSWPKFWPLSAWNDLARLLGYAPTLGACLCLLFGVIGAFWSYRYHQYRQDVLRNARNLAAIQALDWQRFELLVGQLYRQHGYHVTETGLGGADGGIDLVAKKWGSGEKIVVQCKHYRATAVGAPVVRELYGLMAHHRATGAAVVCCGHFTAAAHAFAQGKPLTLVGAEQLLGSLRAIRNR